MIRIKKFNEDISSNISNDKVNEIISELKSISDVLEKDLIKVNNITNDLNKFTSKTNKSNNQIDDSYVNMKTLSSKIKESISIIININKQLNNYNENGEQFLY